MDLKSFIENVAEQFEDTSKELFHGSTNFKELDEWSSLLALSLIAMADEVYSVKLKGDDIKGANTIKDLYDVINERIS